MGQRITPELERKIDQHNSRTMAQIIKASWRGTERGASAPAQARTKRPRRVVTSDHQTEPA